VVCACVEEASVGGTDEDDADGEVDGDGEECGGEDATDDEAEGGGEDSALLDVEVEATEVLVVTTCATLDVLAGGTVLVEDFDDVVVGRAELAVVSSPSTNISF